MFNPLSLLMSLLKGGRIDEFSRELAAEFARRYPLELGAASDKKREKKLGRALNHVYKRAGEFARERSLGVYGTARLGNGFKWALREMGYRKEFIDEATKGLVLNARGK